jgi:hypothetical protein
MTSDDCRKLAVEAERRGMWSEAAQLWREAIARYPDKSNTIAALRDIITCNSAPSVPLRWKRIAAERSSGEAPIGATLHRACCPQATRAGMTRQPPAGR